MKFSKNERLIDLVEKYKKDVDDHYQDSTLSIDLRHIKNFKNPNKLADIFSDNDMYNMLLANHFGWYDNLDILDRLIEIKKIETMEERNKIEKKKLKIKKKKNKQKKEQENVDNFFTRAITW